MFDAFVSNKAINRSFIFVGLLRIISTRTGCKPIDNLLVQSVRFFALNFFFPIKSDENEQLHIVYFLGNFSNLQEHIFTEKNSSLCFFIVYKFFLRSLIQVIDSSNAD